MVWLHYFSALS